MFFHWRTIPVMSPFLTTKPPRMSSLKILMACSWSDLLVAYSPLASFVAMSKRINCFLASSRSLSCLRFSLCICLSDLYGTSMKSSTILTAPVSWSIANPLFRTCLGPRDRDWSLGPRDRDWSLGDGSLCSLFVILLKTNEWLPVGSPGCEPFSLVGTESFLPLDSKPLL